MFPPINFLNLSNEDKIISCINICFQKAFFVDRIDKSSTLAVLKPKTFGLFWLNK